MSITKNSTALKIVAIVVTIMFMFTLVSVNTAYAALTEAQIQSILSLLSSFGADQATIDNVEASLKGQPTSGTGGGSGSSVCPYVWDTNLTQGSTGADVLNLQKFLNDQGSTVASSGAGSAGNETSFYGSLTGAAVVNYQEANSADVLAPVGLSSGVPHFGPSTRAFANSQCTSAPSDGDTGDTTPPPSVGTGLSVGTMVQPVNSIMPRLAARIPFTNFTVTAGSDGAVVMESITVERTGFGSNTALSGIILLDENEVQLGNSKTLNSNNQAKIGVSVTIPAGQTRTFTVAGNRPNTTGFDGQILSLSIIAINTSATVSGTLPITGASHVVNESLTIGTSEISVGPTDPNSNQSEEVGTVNEVFIAVKIDNTSSAEDIRVKQLRFNQSGSAGSNDVANLRVVVDGIDYPLTVDPNDADFFNANLGLGVLIPEGFNKEFVVRGDIIGGTNRNLQFDIEEDTDVFIVGETFGFGVTPTQTQNGTVGASGSQMTAGTPFFDASLFSITTGSLTSFSKSPSVSAQNIAINVPNQILGGFDTNIKGEAITVEQMVFWFLFTDNDGGGELNGTDLTNVSLVNENGSVVAGPTDPVDVVANVGKVTFTDTVTLPLGKHTYTLKGKLGATTAFENDDTIQASTTPSSDWSTIKGDNTGKTVTLTNAEVSGNTMTVKAASITVKVSNNPAPQVVVAGVSQMTVANIQFDGTQSGEDVRFTVAQFNYTDGGDNATNCLAFDGDTQLTDDTVNPTTSGAKTFTFDQNLIVLKGTIKTVAIKCDVPGSSSSGSFSWGINTSDTISGTGIVSGNTVDGLASATTDTGSTMTLASSGALAVTLDSSSPSYAVAAGGTSGITLAILKFAGTNEEQELTKLVLELDSASSSAADLLLVEIFQGSVKVGEAIFTGTDTFATTTLGINFPKVMIPKDDDTTIIIKGSIAEVGVGDP
ncbi:hypothetical protein IID27_02960, partial [Patescibacteria group bacterium]|nr:hypothetical protein [Patescibacteria group bacterium]